ncbi:MAG: ATP-dependent DNA helicase RecQ [Kiritimatiellia bacterium]|jgi:ATP-dependent DNA helicase RecQ
MTDLSALLLDRFGFPGFRPGQEEIVQHMVEGSDALVVMPTGAGKSLCFQVPALARGGLTIVVSPLIALMKDQVDALREKGVVATFLNSSIGREEYRARQEAVRRGEIEMLYVAPERFTPAFLQFLSSVNVQMFAVDEAHCLSQWGHDFRPDYLRLGIVRAKLGDPPTIALTATATPEVQQDIVQTLRLESGRVFIRGFDRENLIMEVMQVTGKAHKDSMLAELVQPGPALVYAATRKNVERAAKALRDAGVPAGMYHAGLDQGQRSRVQEDFMGGNIPVVVATNAFGMGIDKRDIRCIVHYDLPGTVEAYYQEIGRAGRDGRMSRAVLLFNKGDRGIQKFFIDNSHPPAEWVHRVYNWLLDRRENPVYATIEDMSSALPHDAGDRAAAACIYQLQRERMIRRIAPSDRSAELIMADSPGNISPIGVRGAVWSLLEERGVRPGERLNFQLDAWVKQTSHTRVQLTAALRGLQDRGLLTYRAADRRGGAELLQPDQPLKLDEQDLKKRREREYRKLDRMVNYTGAGCRRRYIIEYFGETAPFDTCGTCDQCRSGSSAAAGPRALSPGEEQVVRMLLSCIARMDKHANKTGWSTMLVAQTVTGSRDARVLKWGFESISTYGLLGPRGNGKTRCPGRPWSLGEVSDLIDAVAAAGAIEQRYVTRPIEGKERTYKELHLTVLGWSVMRQSTDDFSVAFPHAAKLSTPSAPALSDLEEDLLTQLRDVRRQLSQAASVPSYVIAPNRTLKEMARDRPTTRAAMRDVHGMGAKRLNAYGPAFLNVIRTWNVTT